MIVDCAHYRAGERQHEEPLEIETAAAIAARAEDGEFVWLGLRDPTDEELDRAQQAFGLNQLAVEDVAQGEQRPKLEEYEDSTFIVLRPARYVDESEVVEFGQIYLFLASSYAIAVRRGEASHLQPARRAAEESGLLRYGPAAVAWAVADKVVDDYAPVLDGIENDIEEVEEEIFSRGEDSTQRIYFLKREVIEFHRAVAPLLPFLELIERGAFEQIDVEVRENFRDVADHARRTDERLMGDRELLTSILEANLALISVRQAHIVRVISAYAAIVAVPTFLASVWGMNFTHMPELDEPWGYWVALSIMALSVLALRGFFRRIGWL